MSDVKSIIENAMEETIRKMVTTVIREHAGYGLDDEIKQTIKEKARELLNSSEELQAMIFNAMKSWITTQTADDFRKRQAEEAKRWNR